RSSTSTHRTSLSPPSRALKPLLSRQS
ncbi:hypothetical protein RSAG8_13842, partial [Rhizoctonia solani AG-8 WAC10335]